jgi:tRNA-specific 2-thiouridylase
VYDKPDSTGICFIGERPFREFLARYIPTHPGDIVTEHGEVVGRHRGSRSIRGAARRPRDRRPRGQREDAWYVAGKNLARNELLAVQGHDHPLARQPCTDTRAVQLAGAARARRIRFANQRFAIGKPTKAATRCCRDGALEVRFDDPAARGDPGQFACCTTANAASAAASSRARAA